MNLPTGAIKNSFRIGRSKPNTADRRNILVKLENHDPKDLTQGHRATKPDDLYINESLTPTCITIMYVLLKANNDFSDILTGHCTNEGCVYMWIKPPNREATGARDSRLRINTFERLNKLCTEIVHFTVTMYVTDWKK